MENNYKFAEHVFQIKCIDSGIPDLLKGYETGKNAEFYIELSQQDIAAEKEGYVKECEKEGVELIPFPDRSFEFTAIYRKVVDAILQYDTLLFHGSVLAVDGKAYMFIAKSGTGKSTHARMWRELLGSRVVMVNDDKPLVRISEKQALAFGTPWNGKHRLGNNISVPLAGICILKRGKENTIRKIPLAEAYPMVLQQVHRPADAVGLAKTMELVDLLEKNVCFYEMHCNISTDAAEMSYNFMSKGE